MYILHRPAAERVSAAVFDFDGTVSTLRCGWEEVMEPLMAETLCAVSPEPEEAVRKRVAAYINESTGIQTIFQMQWLAGEVARLGGRARDPWEYKAEYNRRLMRRVDEKKARLASGQEKAEQYLIAGVRELLCDLRERGTRIYAASGTDHPDVAAEAGALGVYALFDELRGAPPHETGCSKEAVLRELISDRGLPGTQIAVIGDGKVEIALGKQAGCRTLGIASDEARRRGVNPVKVRRLREAGADAICGDFTERTEILAFLGF